MTSLSLPLRMRFDTISTITYTMASGSQRDQLLPFPRLQFASSFGSCNPITQTAVSGDASTASNPTNSPKGTKRHCSSNNKERELTMSNKEPQMLSSSSPPPSSFLALPPEPQQKIFEHAFEQAITEDIDYSYQMFDHLTEKLRLPNKIEVLIVGLAYAATAARRYLRSHRFESAPQVHDLASPLIATHPSFSAALGFVLRNALMEFEDRNEKECRRSYFRASESIEDDEDWFMNFWFYRGS